MDHAKALERTLLGEVYYWCMARTNIDLDEVACHAVMERYHLSTKRDAVNFALRTIAADLLISRVHEHFAVRAGKVTSRRCAPGALVDPDRYLCVG